MEIVIELGNITSKIVSDMPSKLEKQIDKEIACQVPGCQFSPTYKKGFWDGKQHFYSIPKHTFPTGLLRRVCKVIKENGETFLLKDTREVPDVIISDKINLAHSELGEITLRDYQYNAVVSALTATRGIINVATNGGKTEIAVGIMKCILNSGVSSDSKLVFLTGSKEILNQSRDRLQERLGTPVGIIGDNKWDDTSQVIVAMIPTLAKYLKKPKSLPPQSMRKINNLCGDDKKNYEKECWNKINSQVKRTKKLLESTVCIIGDECHHASSTTWYDVIMSFPNATYRFGLTGTVDTKNPVAVMKLHACTGSIISKVSNEFLIEQGHSAKPTIHMLYFDAPMLDTWYQQARSLGIITCKERNEVFINNIQQCVNKGKKCLVIVQEKEHGEIVEQLIMSRGIENCMYVTGDSTSKKRQESINKLKASELDVLIATSIFDEGVDVSGLNCIFLMAGGKSMRQLLQRIGRGLRKKSDGSGVDIYDSVDSHNEYLAEHTLERYNVYTSEGFEVKKVKN